MYTLIVTAALAGAPALAPAQDPGSGIPAPPTNTWVDGDPAAAGSVPPLAVSPPPPVVSSSLAAGGASRTAAAPVASFYYSPGGQAPARLLVRLPADARLLVDGERTRAVGQTRRFISPPLDPGVMYHYDLTAEVVRDGRTLAVRRRVEVRAGEESTVTFEPAGFRVAER
jgi:uncharacterized protein (TIGR03000 family)